MENAVGNERVRLLGLLGEWVNHYSAHPSAPVGKASLGWKRPFPRSWRRVPGQGCWLGAGGQSWGAEGHSSSPSPASRILPRR